MVAQDHPWLDGRREVVDSLNAAERVWTFLAGHTAAGHLDGVAQDWKSLDPGEQVGGLEAVLQTHLFAGYPRAINALITLDEVGVAPSLREDHGERPYDSWRADGEGLCQSIYGGAYAKLRGRMRELHPVMDRWMVETGYGRVLSRPGLTPRQRSFCVIAVLAGQDVPRQLDSHLRGALRVGATRAECEAVLAQTARVWRESPSDSVQETWLRVTAG